MYTFCIPQKQKNSLAYRTLALENLVMPANEKNKKLNKDSSLKELDKELEEQRTIFQKLIKRIKIKSDEN